MQPKVGDPNDLLLQYLPARHARPTAASTCVTSGTVASPDDSLYPPGIPIGQVTSVNEESAYTSVNVHPLANLHASTGPGADRSARAAAVERSSG